ncbi:MAG: penicillin-binding protein [Bacteroidota bacterium]
MKIEQGTIVRTTLVGVFVFVLSVAIIYRLFSIQISADPQITEESERYTRWKEVIADRGNIYADDESLLATTLPIYDVRMDFKADGLSDARFNENIGAFAKAMSEEFGGSYVDWLSDFQRYRRQGKRYQLLKSGINYTELQKVREFPLAELGRFKGGVRFEKKVKRANPFREKARRTIGKYSFGKDKGIYGLELAFDSLLKGRNGQRLERKIASGDWMPLNDDDQVETVDGADVYTSIDINVQDILSEALRKKMVEHEADFGCAIFMEVETGFIKGIVNLDKSESGEYVERYNHAIGTATEPGSTFKLPSILAAIETGSVSRETMVDTKRGRHRFHDRIMKDSNDKGYGKVNIQKAFEVSSNVGISRVVDDVFDNDRETFIKYLRRFGIDQRTGISIPGEPVPFLKTPDHQNGHWSGVTLPWMSIGYELKMTPLQTLTFYNAIANDGVMVQPQLVKRIKRNGELVHQSEPIIINKDFISEGTLNDAKELLKGVVENGTAKNLRSPHFEISGKTGTAQVAMDGRYRTADNKARYQASFVGYFPSDDPKYSCIVLVNNPTKGLYYGNRVAGPVFLEIAEKFYAKNFMIELAEISDEQKAPISKSGYGDDLIQVAKNLNIALETKRTDGEWVRTRAKENAIAVDEITVKKNTIPNVKGMPMMDAIPLLENMGLVVAIEGNGLVAHQSIKEGSSFKPNDQIALTFK